MAGKGEQRQDALDVDRSADFLRRERNVQRFGVAFLILFVAAGLAGAFGNGPLADATVQSGAATIRFERFARQTVRTALEISLAGANTPTISVTLPRIFLDRIDLLDVQPPGSLKLLDDSLATFEVPTHGGSTTLILHYEPKRYGALEADVVVGEQPPAHVRQFVFF